MCILFFYTNPNPQEGTYKLILASNRDEFYVRNAKEASKWNCQPTIISGLDMESGREGGTWLGMGIDEEEINKKLRIGVLLNVTGEQPKSGAKGRGFIVNSYLKFEEKTTQDYINKLKQDNNYRAFNFIGIELVDNNIDVQHYSNVSPEAEIKYVGENVLGFSNSLPHCPLTKVIEGTKRIKEVIDNFNNVDKQEELVNNLINVLKWDKRVIKAKYYQVDLVTESYTIESLLIININGLDLSDRHLPDPELERRASDSFEYRSSIYVSIPIANYGTRTHTVILVDWKNRIQFIEDTMICPIDKDNIKWNKQEFQASL